MYERMSCSWAVFAPSDRHQRWTASRTVQALTDNYEAVEGLNTTIAVENKQITKLEADIAELKAIVRDEGA